MDSAACVYVFVSVCVFNNKEKEALDLKGNAERCKSKWREEIKFKDNFLKTPHKTQGVLGKIDISELVRPLIHCHYKWSARNL